MVLHGETAFLRFSFVVVEKRVWCNSTSHLVFGSDYYPDFRDAFLPPQNKEKWKKAVWPHETIHYTYCTY